MALKITDIQKDLPQLNRELVRLDTHDTQIAKLTQLVGQINKATHTITNRLDNVAGHADLTNTNSFIFTWNGPSLNVTWPAAFVRSGGLKYSVSVVGTSQPLTASTYYWAGFNPAQNKVSFQTSVDTLISIFGTVLICRIFTGTAGQTGVAGGGGSEPGGSGINGTAYKNF